MRLTDFGLSRQMESDEEIACAANPKPNPPQQTSGIRHAARRTTWHAPSDINNSHEEIARADRKRMRCA